MEHRWGRRIVVDIPIRIAGADLSPLREARLVNVSITGALVKADYTPRVLSRLEIVIGSSPSHDGDAVRIAAYVARSHRHGIGLEWCESASLSLMKWLRGTPAELQFESGTRTARAAPRTSSREAPSPPE